MENREVAMLIYSHPDGDNHGGGGGLKPDEGEQ